MHILHKPMEHISVFLCASILCILTINFTLAHDLVHVARARFLLDVFMLGGVSLFLRYALTQVAPFHRALYRISTTMVIWSLGCFLFPYPQTLLYWIVLPAFYFLYRIEVKSAQGQAKTEDKVACGLVLALGAFLYVEQQPFQVLLFANQNFSWIKFYHNSPVILLVGVGFIRLHKHANWPGLILVGILFSLAGVILGLSWILPVPMESIVSLLCIHATLAGFYFSPSLFRFLKRFAGLKVKEHVLLKKHLYFLGNAWLQLCALHTLFNHHHHILALPLVLACTAALLYRPSIFSFSFFFIEGTLIFYPGALLFHSSFPLMAIKIMHALLLGLFILLRRDTSALRFSYPMAVISYVWLHLPCSWVKMVFSNPRIYFFWSPSFFHGVVCLSALFNF